MTNEQLAALAWNKWFTNIETNYAKKHMEIAFLAGFHAGQLVVRTASEDDVERVKETRSGLAIGDRVEKVKGSCWTGRVVGFYRTELTPYGVCVESEREPGSVQIYPEAALKIMSCDEEPRAAIAAMVR